MISELALLPSGRTLRRWDIVAVVPARVAVALRRSRWWKNVPVIGGGADELAGSDQETGPRHG